MSRTLYGPMSLAVHLARAAQFVKTTTGDGRVWTLRECPGRLSDGSPCQKTAILSEELERHLLISHNLNSRRADNWRDAHESAARMQGCVFMRTWSDADMGDMNEWRGIVIESRVGHFLHGREAHVRQAGFACERFARRGKDRTYVMVDAGLNEILAATFKSAPTRAEAIRLGYMILCEAERQGRGGA